MLSLKIVRSNSATNTIFIFFLIAAGIQAAHR
jgi:hypothetical protein